MLSHKQKKYRAKEMRYADGGGMNAQREEVVERKAIAERRFGRACS